MSLIPHTDMVLSKTMTPLIIKQLTFLRQNFIHALDMSGKNSAFGRAQSLLTCDYCIELCLNIILTSEKKSKPLEKSFEALWKAANIAYKESVSTGPNLPLPTQIKSLHEHRNLIQHHADIPGKETVEKYLSITEAFLGEIVSSLYSTNFEDISMSHAISDKEVRKYVESSEKHFSLNKYRESYADALTGFEIAVEKAIKNFPKDTFFTPFFVGQDFGGGMFRSEAIEKIVREINKLDEKVNVVALGIDFTRYSKIKKQGYRVVKFETGEYEFFSTFTISEAEAKEALNFVSESLIKFENQD